MKTLEFEVDINAPKQTVWDILWDDDTYREWTKAFSADSHAVSDWKEGSSIHFLDGKGNGMYSEIARRNEPEQMTFRHLGEIHAGKQVPKDWAGALEHYELTETGGGTNLKVRVDMEEQFCEMMGDMFPNALNNVKRLAEKQVAEA